MAALVTPVLSATDRTVARRSVRYQYCEPRFLSAQKMIGPVAVVVAGHEGAAIVKIRPDFRLGVHRVPGVDGVFRYLERLAAGVAVGVVGLLDPVAPAVVGEG